MRNTLLYLKRCSFSPDFCIFFYLRFFCCIIKMMRKSKNLVLTFVSIFLLAAVFSCCLFFPENSKVILFIGFVFALIIILYNYLVLSDFFYRDTKPQSPVIYSLEDKNKVIKKIDRTRADSFGNIVDDILYPLEMIETAARLLADSGDSATRICVSDLIKKNVHEIKNTIGHRLYGLDETTEENNIPLDMKRLPAENGISDRVSIGIFGDADADSLRLRLILQSYGFFVRIMASGQEVLSCIEDGLIQLLMISPQSETDGSFVLCSKIREKFTLLDFPILVIVNKYRSYLVEKSCGLQINDFLVRPFDVSALLARIQILVNYRTLYLEKQELLKSEREKRAFLYFVTHNVNTPLTILLNEIEVLSAAEKESLSAEGKECLANIKESADRINIIIQNVLSSYKISDGRLLLNPKIINLRDFVEMENSFLADKAEFKGQNFSFSCTQKSPRVFCDENSLKGIYGNLVDNAIKYTEPGGNIRILVDGDDESVYLRVIDDGQGIPREKQLVLFSRFSDIGSKPTGHEKSVGLGLYVVNELCSLNNISVGYSENSQDGRGSVFSVKFQKVG